VKQTIGGKDGKPIDAGALMEMVMTALRRHCKRGTVVKHGTSRNVRWDAN
jgi:hypothetical protein